MKLTDEGSKTLSYFGKNDLSQDIRNEIEEFLRDYGYEMPERILMPADYYTTPQGNLCGSVPADRKGCYDHGSDNGCARKEAARAIKSWPHFGNARIFILPLWEN